MILLIPEALGTHPAGVEWPLVCGVRQLEFTLSGPAPVVEGELQRGFTPVVLRSWFDDV